jgi:putative ABC transport system permease protein
MEIRPILSALRRNPVAGVLIAAQIALTLAILANVLFIVSERVEKMAMSSGVDEANVFFLANQNIGKLRDPARAVDEDLVALRAMPGVVAAAGAFSMPMGRSGWQTSITLKPDEKTDGADRSAAVYFADTQYLKALDAKVIEGREFTPGEITTFTSGMQPNPPVVMVAQSLAERLFPGESAIGKMINITGDPGLPQQRIVGIVDQVATPWPRRENPDRIVYVPYVPAGFGFVVRTQPGERDRVMAKVEDLLFSVNPNRIIPSMRSFDEIRTEAYRNDRAMAVLLTAIGIALLAVTAFGIVGQASFWVTQRTKQIGTRRALGARRVDILRHFQTENALITLIGIALGCLLAIGINTLLVNYLGFDRLPWTWLPVGAVVVLLLGQLAVLGPAMRASKIAPAIATRTA